MHTQYDLTEYLSAVYADSTETRLVRLDEGVLYAHPLLSIHGVTAVKEFPLELYGIETQFRKAESGALGGRYSRIFNSLVAIEDSVASVVIPLAYDKTLVDRIKGLVSSLRDYDSNRAFQYISLLSNHTHNKLSEYNVAFIERKSRRSGAIKPCPL